MLFLCFVQRNGTKKASTDVLVVFNVFCCLTFLLKGNIQYMWQEKIKSYIYVIDILKDVSKVVDYL